MEPLKVMFNPAYFAKLARVIKIVHSTFAANRFLNEVTKSLTTQSLNERMRHAASLLPAFLPASYPKAVGILKEAVSQMPPGYTNLLFPEYVAMHGQNHFEESLDALHYFTSFGSSEFAIRVFLKNDLNRTLPLVYRWAEDNNEHVRRLASEGTRPRLPWSFKLEAFANKPQLAEPILSTLRADEALYVRKSVANHLNDISKDSPDYALTLIRKWDLTHPHTSWIVKRGCRSLLKQGDKQSLRVFGFSGNPKVVIKALKLDKREIRLNETLSFSVSIQSAAQAAQKLMIDYRIYFQKKTGKAQPKVFKWKELTIHHHDILLLTKRQRFQDFTTRKHYPGRHRVEVLVNGEVMAHKDFRLVIK
ncbi:MAG: DNA alkylation repair protein [Bacteroidota bacterium]